MITNVYGNCLRFWDRFGAHVTDKFSRFSPRGIGFSARFASCNFNSKCYRSEGLEQMDDDMWRLWFTKLLLLVTLLLTITSQTRSEGESRNFRRSVARGNAEYARIMALIWNGFTDNCAYRKYRAFMDFMEVASISSATIHLLRLPTCVARACMCVINDIRIDRPFPLLDVRRKRRVRVIISFITPVLPRSAR